VSLQDVHGFAVTRTLELVPSGGGACKPDR
jgi:hypothetical protein